MWDRAHEAAVLGAWAGGVAASGVGTRDRPYGDYNRQISCRSQASVTMSADRKTECLQLATCMWETWASSACPVARILSQLQYA